MDTKIQVLTALKTQLVRFLDELVSMFPEESDFIIFRIFVKDRIPVEVIMEYIVENLCPLEQEVRAKNEKFFLERNILFEKFNPEKTEKVSRFRTLWASKNLDQSDRDTIWDWFKAFIILGKKFSSLEKNADQREKTT